jgi:hypothetical protein
MEQGNRIATAPSSVRAAEAFVKNLKVVGERGEWLTFVQRS